jgi:IS5 family transposase
MSIAQQCFGLSDEGVEDALYDSQAIRGFVSIDLSRESAPDAATLLKFRRLLEKHKLTERIFAAINTLLAVKGLILKEGTVVDATIIAAPQGAHSGQGRASVPHRQEHLRHEEDTLQRAGQEHGATLHAVRPGESADRQAATLRPQCPRCVPKVRPEMGEMMKFARSQGESQPHTRPERAIRARGCLNFEWLQPSRVIFNHLLICSARPWHDSTMVSLKHGR